MSITPSQLRADVYRLIDQVIETGKPLEIIRNGHIVRLVPTEPVSVLSRLIPHPDYIIGDPESLVHNDWSSEWDPQNAVATGHLSHRHVGA